MDIAKSMLQQQRVHSLQKQKVSKPSFSIVASDIYLCPVCSVCSSAINGRCGSATSKTTPFAQQFIAEVCPNSCTGKTNILNCNCTDAAHPMLLLPNRANHVVQFFETSGTIPVYKRGQMLHANYFYNIVLHQQS